MFTRPEAVGVGCWLAACNTCCRVSAGSVQMSVQMVSALGLISQKATLNVQHSSFVHFFAALFWLLTWNLQKLHKYPFYGGNVVRVLVSIFFFHCRWFSPCIGGRKLLRNFHLRRPVSSSFIKWWIISSIYITTLWANPCINRPKSTIRGKAQKIKIALLLQTGRL